MQTQTETEIEIETTTQIRYLVHFAEGGTGIRSYASPLEEAEVICEWDDEYVLTRVDQPHSPDEPGYAWAQLA